MVTQLKGFADNVHDAQTTFRALLDALARPGKVQTPAFLTPPAGLAPSCAAACLTLLDLETVLWLQPGLPEAVRPWLVFHTGCRLTPTPREANFALIWEMATAPHLSEFHWGTPEYPEASTSLLVQLPSLTGGQTVTLAGPGIVEQIPLALPVETDFWQQWQTMAAEYPLGVDCWWFAQEQVVGLPRTAKLTAETRAAETRAAPWS